MENYHVKKHGDHWDLTREGADRATISRPSKGELLTEMQAFMANKIGSVRVHGEDGRLLEERTYPRSLDPSQTKG